ncbi:MAG TPA: alcohol dehydrogenase catalytic domain-containing protein [Jatrophihabitans sp.]|nr:alcohol dehydrogenase catalytic domain-containing protein [Jatrophihabitans sp.]
MSSAAVVMDAFGGADVLTLRRVEVAEPAPDQVLLRVLATTVNHLDVDVRDGTSRMPIPLPHVLGREIVGEVVRAGDGSSARLGQRYLVLPNVPCGRCARCLGGHANLCREGYLPGISGWGGYAEHVLVPARGLVPIGDLTPEVAAATPISFGTAWRMLYVAGRTLPGETVLVVGAAGGLGHASVQLAKLGGARVIALISDPAKEQLVRDCGADEVVSTRAEDWPHRAVEAAGAAGIDVVIEHVGGTVFENIVPLVNETGRILVGGGHGGEHPRLDVIETFRKELQLIGVRSQTPADIERVLDLAASGLIRPHIDSIRPLAQVRAAHEALTARSVLGKQVIVP